MKNKLIDNLSPCPRCKGIAEVKMVGANKHLYIICCSNCGYTPFQYNEAQIFIVSAIKLWKRRVEENDC